MMELERISFTCTSPSSRKKRNIIAAPRPVAPVPLKHSGASLPVFLHPLHDEAHEEFEEEFDLDSVQYDDLDAESEFQQILGCGFQSGGPDAYFDGLNELSLDSGDYPFQLSISSMDFPRLGPSPVSFNTETSVHIIEEEYPLPSRAHNPMIRNSIFGYGEEQRGCNVQLTAALTAHLKLALGFAPFEQVQTRNRSYSEPTPFVPEQHLKEPKLTYI